MRVILEVTKGPNKGERFVFQQHQAFVVGRKKNERVQFRIPSDPYFSRYHMMIEVSPPDCFLRDLGSRNYTYVNGEQKHDAHLKDGDVIHGGRTEMRVRIEEYEPLPEEEAAEPVSWPAPEDEPASVDMETRAFGRVPSRGGPGQLRCRLCKKLAKDSQLGDLTDTRMIAYVCSDCRREHHDPEHPIPNYEKLGVLGRGALGPVYKARRISTDKLVALKMISPQMAADPEAAKLFLRQMLLAARLEHPKIVPIIEMGQAGDDLWIATEFVDGADARELARRLGGTVPLGDAGDIVCQMLQALDYAHGLNLVHRDVKPSNILVTGQPGSYAARLADFGLMRNMDEAGVSGITREGEVRGTVPFMPPEQVLDCRFVKPAGDVYSAGATLYWLLTGEFVRDFEARDPRGDRKDPYMIILDDSIVPIRQRNPSIPESAARVIETALADEPEDRFDSAAEMARELGRTGVLGGGRSAAENERPEE